MRKVPFIITQFLDPRKQGSELELNKTFLGELHTEEVDKIYYTDVVGTEWIFYPGETCIVLPKWGENKHKQTIYTNDKLIDSNGDTFFAHFDQEQEKWIDEDKYFNAYKLNS